MDLLLRRPPFAIKNKPHGMLQDISYRVQGYGVRLVIAVFSALPVDAASGLGGWLARRLGPFTTAHKIAADNIREAFPGIDDVALQQMLVRMWDNIGRTFGEYPHLAQIMNDPARVEIIDPMNEARRLKDDGIGALLIGMHYGNWELSTVPGHRQGIEQYIFYRAPNNPYADSLLKKLRTPLLQHYLAKGADGARQAMMLLKNGWHIGMLVDQKLDEGIAVPFFGRDAMTTTAPAVYARRLNVPIVTALVVRQKGAKFRIYVKAVEVAKTADREADIRATTMRINAMFEGLIRNDPAQWFWVHRRWPARETA